jgi:hypothetical protein
MTVFPPPLFARPIKLVALGVAVSAACLGCLAAAQRSDPTTARRAAKELKRPQALRRLLVPPPA